MTNVLESARAFARARFPVFPCGQDKRPRVNRVEFIASAIADLQVMLDEIKKADE